MKNKKTTAIIIIILVILLSAYSVFSDILGRNGGKEKEIKVEAGESFSSVIEKLEEEGIIRHKLLFKYYALKNGVDTNLKAGTHKMNEAMGYKKIGEELKNGGMGNNTVILTIPEGFEIKDIAKEVNKVFGISQEEFTASQKDFKLDFLPERENPLEGYLFPDSYEFYKDATPSDIIEKMLSGFESIWTEDFEKQAKKLDMTIDEVIILASIIEREAGNVDEMGKVSSVFHNRLKINMPLQSCATVQYILKERKLVLSIADTKIDSPYNTYLYPGLPVGPVSNPGRAAIEAALYPDDTGYYYFKVNESGETLFSKTLAEHNSK